MTEDAPLDRLWRMWRRRWTFRFGALAVLLAIAFVILGPGERGPGALLGLLLLLAGYAMIDWRLMRREAGEDGA